MPAIIASRAKSNQIRKSTAVSTFNYARSIADRQPGEPATMTKYVAETSPEEGRADRHRAPPAPPGVMLLLAAGAPLAAPLVLGLVAAGSARHVVVLGTRAQAADRQTDPGRAKLAWACCRARVRPVLARRRTPTATRCSTVRCRLAAGRCRLPGGLSRADHRGAHPRAAPVSARRSRSAIDAMAIMTVGLALPSWVWLIAPYVQHLLALDRRPARLRGLPARRRAPACRGGAARPGRRPAPPGLPPDGAPADHLLCS